MVHGTLALQTTSGNIGYGPGRVDTARGTVRADRVVVATEGYGATLPATRRRVLPLYSLMIATEPLPASFWDGIGIEHGQTFTDFRHLLIYGQRTADDRFAFGGRGALRRGRHGCCRCSRGGPRVRA